MCFKQIHNFKNYKTPIALHKNKYSTDNYFTPETINQVNKVKSIKEIHTMKK